MTGIESGEEHHHRGRDVGAFTSARRNVQERLSFCLVLSIAGVVAIFLIVVGLVMYFKPGSTAEPTGEPALDIFAAGPIREFEAGTMTLYENEHIFLVRM